MMPVMRVTGVRLPALSVEAYRRGSLTSIAPLTPIGSAAPIRFPPLELVVEPIGKEIADGQPEEVRDLIEVITGGQAAFVLKDLIEPGRGVAHVEGQSLLRLAPSTQERADIGGENELRSHMAESGKDSTVRKGRTLCGFARLRAVALEIMLADWTPCYNLRS